MRKVLAGTLLVVTLALAGCGGGSSSVASNGEASKPAKQVLADAVKAANTASSAHVSGYVRLFFAYGSHRVVLDVTVEKGKGAMGTITSDGLKADVVVIGNWNVDPCPQCKAYLRASPAFWAYWASRAGISDPSSLNGKWLEFSPSDEVLDLEPFATMADLQGVLGPLTSKMGALIEETTTYKGHSVVALYGTAKVRSVYVAATGTPYPVLAAAKGSSPYSVAFDNWGKPVTVTAPSGAVEVSKLGG